MSSLAAVDHFQYLMLLGACVLVTLPLEVVLGAKVWRRPARLLRSLWAPVVLFSCWDVVAIGTREWSFSPRYVTGWELPGRLPVEEVAFFVVIPTCALLTFEVLEGLQRRSRERRVARTETKAGGGST